MKTRTTMMNITATIFFALLFIFNFGTAQTNLVSNASFENSVGCKVGTGIYNNNNPVNNYITGWNRPTSHSGTPYNFSNCTNSSNYNTPKNKYGYQQPRTGTKYVGLQTYKSGNNPDRQYIQTMLSTPLVAGKVYQMSMYVSLGNKSEYATNKIGMYVSQTKIVGAGNKKNLPYTPQVVSSVVITDTANWTLISGTFLATGGEQYLTIGNFSDDLNTTKTLVSAGSGYGNNRALYYIEDVRIVEVLTPPVAAFATNPTPATGVAPLSVSLIDQSTGGPTSWLWTITPSTGFTYTTGSATSQNPVVNFTAVGTYSVTLRATNAQGNNTSAPKTITVTIPPPVASFTASPASGARLTSTGLAVTFTSTSTGNPTSLAWDIDNNGSTDGTVSPFTYTFPVSAAGAHNNKLTATNAGGSNSITTAYNLLMPNPVANFTANGSATAITGAAPFAVTLSNTTNSFGYVNTYVWSISPAVGFSYVGGTNANSQNPQLSFTNAGTYSITLTANTTDGGTGTITKSGFVTVTANQLPVANFTPLSTTATGTATVTFNSSSSTGNPTAYSWVVTPMTGVTFTSGTATSANPTIKFDNVGATVVNYTVALTVTNAYGNNTKTQTNCVVVNPIPAITYYSRANGNWNVNATWSTSPTGSPIATNYPKNNDIVYIKHRVTVPTGRVENCGTVTGYLGGSTQGLIVFGDLTTGGDLTITNAAGVTGGNFDVTIDSSGSLTAGAAFNLILNQGTFDMTLGRSADDATDCDPDARIEEDGSFTTERFNVAVSGTTGNVNFTTASSGSSIGTGSGNSIFTQTNSSGKIQFTANWGSSMDFSYNDTLKIDHISGGDFVFQTNQDGSTLSFTELVINQKLGNVEFDINDGGVVEVGGNLRCNVAPASTANTSALFTLGLGSYYQVGTSDDACTSREWLSVFSIDNDFIITQNYGGNINIDLNGYVDNDGWQAGPELSIGNDLFIDHKATGKNVTFTIANASIMSVYNLSTFKNTGTGAINFNMTQEASVDLADVDFQTGLTTINVAGSSQLDVYNVTFPVAGSAININETANLNLRGNVTRASGLSNIIKPAANATVTYNASSPQTIIKSGTDVFYTNLKLNNPTGLTLEGIVNVPNTLTMENGKVNLNNYELKLGTSVTSNGKLNVIQPYTTVVDSVVLVPNAYLTAMYCPIIPQLCTNGVWYDHITYSRQVAGDPKGWFYGAGKFTRWMPNSLVTINSDSALFPMGDASAANRYMRIAKTSVSGSNGTVSVTHNAVAGDANVNINDGGTAIKFLTNSNWNVSTTITNTTVRFDLQLQGKGLGFSAGLDKIRIAKATSVVGTHAAATGDLDNPKGNRTTLTAAQLAGIFYLGSTSTTATKSFQIEEATEVSVAEDGLEISNLYPNPTVSEAFLNINNSTESNVQAEIQIMDLTGRIVFSANQTLEIGENNMNINVSGLNTGTYMLRVISENGNAVKRFVKSE